MVPRYRFWLDLWTDFPARAEELARGADVTRVCELGGGANPMLRLGLIEERGLDHEIVDVSAEELAKAPAGYRTVQADATSPEFVARGPYDLIVTAFLAEHVPDSAALHRAVHAALRPGGIAFHVFPTLYEPAFVLNRLLPEALTDALLHRVQPGREAEGSRAKFRAYYRWCRGPSRRQLRRLEAAGFVVVEYTGYFGHNYFRKLPPLHRAEQALSRALARRPLPALTSYATVVLRRPERHGRGVTPATGAPCGSEGERLEQQRLGRHEAPAHDPAREPSPAGSTPSSIASPANASQTCCSSTHPPRTNTSTVFISASGLDTLA